VKNISPIDILLMTKLVENLISYKKCSGNFYVQLTQINVMWITLSYNSDRSKQDGKIRDLHLYPFLFEIFRRNGKFHILLIGLQNPSHFSASKFYLKGDVHRESTRTVGVLLS
jgi:hypothetical protein